MARIKVSLPDSYIFTTTIPVRITDLNYGNHVGNDAFLSMMHEVRVQFLESRGWSEMNVEGFGVIMTDAAIEYKAQMHYGDVVMAELGIMDITRVGFDLCYRFSVSNNSQSKITALGKTGMVLFDYGHQKVVPLSELIIEKLKG